MSRDPETVTLQVPAEILEASGLSLDELRAALAVALYEQGRLSTGRARQLAGVSVTAFYELLAEHGVEVRYTVEDVEHDVAVAEQMRP